jgi:MFS transporter, putative metabolite:H+ symporter
MLMSGQGQAMRWRRFEHPVAFWLGTVACTAGVALHIPMYVGARDMGYRMAGMHPDAAMLAGMALIVAGLPAALFGLLPRAAGRIRERAARIRLRALDDAPLRWRHVALLLVVSTAIIIDAMKPATLAFVAPGMAAEYGLKAATNPGGHIPVAWLPLAGIGGTVAGSLMWGWLADRIGRRSSILFAGLLFVTTSICGAMPGFSWNLFMCFLMGVGVGGMLPIAFALLAETIPARHRGWLMVLVGGCVIGAGYVLTSWLAGALIPHFSWRIMWLIGLPTGLLVIALNRWIPESPRYLIAAGQAGEAEKIMREFGAVAVATEHDDPRTGDRAAGYRHLLGSPFTWSSLAIIILAAGTGLVAFGFQLWVPANLQHLGLTSVNSAYIVRNAAVIGLAVSVGATFLYGYWGAKKTIVILFGLTALALAGFVIEGDGVIHNHVVLTALLAIPLSGAGLASAVVTLYAAEAYPTALRARGTALAAGSTKAGGLVIIAMVVAAATTPSIALTAAVGAVPLLAGTVIFARHATETRQRSLEDIGEAELEAELMAGTAAS